MTADQTPNITGMAARHGATALAVVLAVAHFICIMQYFEPATSARDAQAYFAQARLMASTGKPYLETESLVQYTGFHWTQTSERRFYSKYPPGLPAILAAAYRAGGPHAMLWVNPILASLALLAVFLIGLQWAGPGWGLAAMSLMAVNPLANKHALYGDSHTASVFFLIWAVFLVAEWTRSRRPWLLIAAGLFAGCIPSIRYSEVLFLPALAAYVMLESEGGQHRMRNVLLFAAGAAGPILALCLFNHAAFGAFWKTGYASEAGAFAWTYFKQAFPSYPQRMLAEGGAYGFALGVFGAAMLCTHPERWKQGALLAGLIIPVTLIYMFFFVAPFAPVRYLLPTLPLYSLGAAWFLKELASAHRTAAAAAAAAIVLLTAYWGLPLSHQELALLQSRHKGLAMATEMLRAHAPRGSVVIADEGICQQLDNLGFWRLADESLLLRRGMPDRAPAGTFDAQTQTTPREAEQQQRYANLTPPQLMAAFKQDARIWARPSRAVYWITTQERMDSFTNGRPQDYGLVPRRVLQIPLPEPRARRPIPMPVAETVDPRFQNTRPGSTLILYHMTFGDVGLD